MNTKRKQKRLCFRLITFLVITVFLCQDVSWAWGNKNLAIPSKIAKLNPVSNEFLVASAVAKVLMENFVSDMSDLQKKIGLIQSGIGKALSGGDRDFKFGIFDGNIYVIRKHIVFRFVLGKQSDSLYSGMFKKMKALAKDGMNVGNRKIAVEVYKITEKIEDKLNLAAEFMPGKLNGVRGVPEGKQRSGSAGAGTGTGAIPSDLHKRMVKVYQYIKKRDLLSERLEGDEIGIRDMKAWVRYIKRYEQELGIELSVIKGARYVFGDRIESEKQKDFDDILHLKTTFADFFPKISAGSGYSDKIEIIGGKIKIRDITLAVQPFSGPYVPSKESADLIVSKETPSMWHNLEKAAGAIALDDPLLLVGDTGVAKTSICRFLAYLTNNNFRRFNLNGQTDKMEFIGGNKPQPDGSMKWEDGILIKAMQNGDWLLLDEINLAESEILERINSLLDDERSLTVSEHEGERYVPKAVYDEMVRKGQNVSKVFPINPNFRIMATMNPQDYEGRKKLSPAFMNRFRIKWIEELPAPEMLHILKIKYNFNTAVLKKIYELHIKMKSLKLEKKRFTLRDLFRLADRVKVYWTSSGLDMNDLLLRESWEVYGDGLSEKEEVLAFKKVLIAIFGKVDCLKGELKFTRQGKNIVIGDCALPVFESQPGSAPRTHVPGAESYLVPVSTTMNDLYKLAKCVEMDEKCMMIGPTGAAKTSYVRYLAHITNNNFRRINLDGLTDTSELIGEYVPTGIPGKYKWRDGILVEAMKNGDWVLLDEFNLACPEIMERINSLLDDDGYLVLTEHEGEKIIPNPNFRLFSAMNPDRDAGRQRISPATKNKFNMKWISGEMPQNEMIEVAAYYLTKGGGVEKREEEMAKEMVKFHLEIVENVKEQRLGGKKLGPEAESDYSFSLRDIKVWSNYIKKFGEEKSRGLALIKGAVYVYRDRLRIESMEEMERFRRIAKGINFNKFNRGTPINLDDILEPPHEFRNRLERVMRGEVAGEDAGDILFVLTQGYPQVLEKPIKEIVSQLGSSKYEEKIKGISALRLLPGFIGQKIFETLMKNFNLHHNEVKFALLELVARTKIFQSKNNLDILLKNFYNENDRIKQAIIKSAGSFTHDLAGVFMKDILAKFDEFSGPVQITLIETMAGLYLIEDAEFYNTWKNILKNKRYGPTVRSTLAGLILEHNVKLGGRKQLFKIMTFFKMLFKIRPGSDIRFAPARWYAVQNMVNIIIIGCFGLLGILYYTGFLAPISIWLRQIAVFLPVDPFTGIISGFVAGGVMALIINLLLKFAVVSFKLAILYRSIPIPADEFYELVIRSEKAEREPRETSRLKPVPDAPLFIEHQERMAEITARNIAMWEEETKTGKVTNDAYATGKIEVSADGKYLKILDTILPINTEKIVPSSEDIKKLTLNRSTLENLEKLAQAAALDDPVLLIGETGIGKTSLVRYIAHLTGNTFRRFNLNGQTDKQEFIGGYKPSPGGGLDWFNGILIDAMKNGHWLLLDEMNLAEPQVLERINSLLDDDRSIVAHEHLGEKYVPQKVYDEMKKKGVDVSNVHPINPNFRLFAAMNPSEETGRNILSPAFMNRFRVKWIAEPLSDEMLGILLDQYYLGEKDMQKLDDMLMAKIILFHKAMQELAADRVLGADETELYRFTLRNLLRLMDRITDDLSEVKAAGELMEDELVELVVKHTRRVYGDMIRHEIDRNTFNNLLNVYFKPEKEEEEEYEIKVDEEGARIGDIHLKKRPQDITCNSYVPGESAVLCNVPTTTRYVHKMAQAVKRTEPVLLVGPTGSSKTSLVRYLAHLTGNNYVRVNLDCHTDTSELMGEYMPTGEKGKYVWKDGILIEAMKNGYWLLFDEFNLAEPEIIERINSLLDDDGFIILTEHEGEKIKPHPNFRLFCAMNPADYKGRNRLSSALRNKFAEIWVSGEFEEDELLEIVLGYLGENSGNEELAAKMIDLHQKFRLKELGQGEEEIAELTIRDLKSWARYIKKFTSALGLEAAFNMGAHYVYGNRLINEKLRIEFNALLPLIKEEDMLNSVIKFIGRNPKGGELVPPKEISELILTESTKRNLTGLISSVALKDPMLLVGETGAGKTSLIRYLAYLTNNNLRRFNLNGQTDKFEFLGGYRPQADGSIKWEDGILIKAMKNGDWIILDEINLAEPQVLERINSLLDDDGYIVLREHEGEVIKPHPNFRLFATMNPAEYSGRKELSKAMMNRFRIKWIDEPKGGELKQIIKEKYKGRLPENLLDRLINIHAHISASAKEDQCFTIRNLIKLVERVKFRLQKGVEVINEEVKEVYGTKMDVPYTPYRINKQNGKVDFGGVELLIKQGSGEDVPGEDAELVPVNTTLKYLRKIAKAVLMNEKPLLVGKTGTGKTALVRYLARLTNTKFVRLNLDGQTDTAELIGEYVPGPQKGTYVWKDGILLDAMKKGYWILLDEVNLAEPDILERINSLLDDDSKLIITEHKGEVIRPHRDFRLFCAMNPPEGYSGRKNLSLAFKNKMTEMWLPDELEQNEMEYIVGSLLGMKLQVPDIENTTYPNGQYGEPSQRDRDVYSMLPAYEDEFPPPSSTKSKKGAGFSFARPRYKAMTPAETGTEELGILDKYKLRKKKKEVNRIMESIIKATGGDVNVRVMPGAEWGISYDTDPVTILYPVQEFLNDDIEKIIGYALHESGHRKISYASGFIFEKDTRRLLYNAIEDPRANNWQIRTLRGGKKYIDRIYDEDWPENPEIEYDDEKALPHEQFIDGVIYRWRYGKECPAIKNQKVLDALEETRDAVEEAYGILPGSEITIVNQEGKLSFHTEEGDLDINLPLKEEIAKTIPNTNIKVKVKPDGIISILTAVGERVLRIPEEGRMVKMLANVEPSEADIKLAAQRANKIVKEKILPVYQGLVDESKEIVKKLIKKGIVIVAVPGMHGGGRGQISDELLPEGAEAYIEQKAKEMADKLQGKIEGGDVREAKKEAEKAREAKEGKQGEGKPKEGKPKEGKPSMDEKDKQKGGSQDVPARTDDEQAFRELLRVEKEKEKVRKEALKERVEQEYEATRYDEWRRPIRQHINRLVGFLDNILRKESRPKYKGNFRTGRKLNLRKVMQLDHKIKEDLPLTSEDYKVMLRKTKPVKRNHKFTIVLDESGSMTELGVEKNAISGLIMFMESLGLLDIDFCVIGFHSSYVFHKEFKEKADFRKREEILREVNAAMGRGGTNDSLAVKVALDDILKEPATDRTIIVITDGCGNGIGEMGPVLREAEKEKVKVIGIGIGKGMEYVKDTYSHAKTCDTLEDVPEAVANVLVEQVFSKVPGGRRAYEMLKMKRQRQSQMQEQKDSLSGAASQISVSVSGTEEYIDEAAMNRLGTLTLMRDSEKGKVLGKVHQTLKKFYGRNIFIYARGVRIKKNPSQGCLAHYQDDYIDYDERLFSIIPGVITYPRVLLRENIDSLALLFDQAEHELMESILAHTEDIPPEIKEITVILQNVMGFLDPNRRTNKLIFDEKKYQDTILRILSKDEENGIDPEERYRNLLLTARDKKLSKKQIILTIAGYLNETERYKEISAGIGNLKKWRNRKRIIKGVLSAEKVLHRILELERAAGLWHSLVEWLGDHLSFNPRFLSVGAIATLFFLLIRIFILPASWKFFLYREYYNHRAEYHIQQIIKSKDRNVKRTHLIKAMDNILKSLRYSTDENIRKKAITMLAELGQDIPILIRHVIGIDELYYKSEEILLELGPVVLPYIFGDMEKADEYRKGTLIEFLFRLAKGRYGKEITEQLEKKFGPDYEKNFKYYLYIIYREWDKFVRMGKDGVKHLLFALRGRNWLVYWDNIKEAILKVGAKGVDPLLDGLENNDTRIRTMSAEVLWELRYNARNILEKRLGPDYEKILECYLLFKKYDWFRLEEMGRFAIKPLRQFINDKRNSKKDIDKANEIFDKLKKEMYRGIILKIREGKLSKREILDLIRDYLIITKGKIDKSLMDVYKELVKSARKREITRSSKNNELRKPYNLTAEEILASA